MNKQNQNIHSPDNETLNVLQQNLIEPRKQRVKDKQINKEKKVWRLDNTKILRLFWNINEFLLTKRGNELQASTNL